MARQNRIKGEGSIDFCRNRWRWRGWYIDAEGKRKEKSLYAHNRTALIEKAARWKLAYQAGEAADTNLTMQEWCKIWMDDVVSVSCKPKTIQNYQACVKNHILPCCGRMKLLHITPIWLQNYFNHLLLDHAANSVISIRRIFLVCFNSAVNYGFLADNPAQKTKPPRKPPQQYNALSPQQSAQLMEVLTHGAYLKKDQADEASIYLQHCYRMAVHLAMVTGCREGEIFGLRWKDVAAKQILIAQTLSATCGGPRFDTPKTECSTRTIPLPKVVSEELIAWNKEQKSFAKKFAGIFLNVHDLVFTNSYGKPVNVSNFLHRCFYPALKLTGIEWATFHTLRHTHASELLAQGVDIQIVSQRLGHSNPSVTLNIYKHVMPIAQDAAVSVLERLYSKKA